MLNIGKILIISGIVLLLSGLVVTMLDGKVKWFGNMPLDFKFKTESTQIHVPFGTMIILSIILSFLANLFFRWFK